MTGTLPDIAPDFRALLERHADRLDLEQIDRALRFSASAHRGQKRVSGEDFIQHSIAVARTLVEQQLDTTSIVAALLHDVVEDSDIRTEDIAREFGAETANIVDGLTKIASLTFRSTAEQQVENYRKLLLSIAKDARVIIIKLADRLHNMRTLDPLPPEKRARIATETREIYAPLAHRFGMAGIKAELEDAFKFLEAEDYRALVAQVQARRAEREQMILKLRSRSSTSSRPRGSRGAGIPDSPSTSGRSAEDEEAQQAVRRDLRPRDGRPGDRQPGRVLPCQGSSPQLNPGTDQEHRESQVERLPVARTIFGPATSSGARSAPEMHRTAEYGIAARWLYKADEAQGDRPPLRTVQRQPNCNSRTPTARNSGILKVNLYQARSSCFAKEDVKQAAQGAADRRAFIVTPTWGSAAQGAKVTAGQLPCTAS